MTKSPELVSVNLDTLGLLRITGTQASGLLQGQLSCDIGEVTSHKSCIAVHCNPQGRVLATLRLFYYQDAYYLLLPQSNLEGLYKDLKKYALFYKVHLQIIDSITPRIGLIGIHLSEFLVNRISDFQAEENNSVYLLEGVIIIMLPGDIPRAILLGLSPSSWIETIALPSIPASYWEYLDINSGLATIYPNTRGLFTPHHINCHNTGAISFTKGCYTGQEIIARMHYLGKLTQQLYHLTVLSQNLPEPGVPVLDSKDNRQGIVVMAVWRPDYLQKTVSTYQALVSLKNKAVHEPLFIEGSLIQTIEAVSSR
jgi:folate-binding protein YgfZ